MRITKLLVGVLMALAVFMFAACSKDDDKEDSAHGVKKSTYLAECAADRAADEPGTDYFLTCEDEWEWFKLFGE
jgi:hypothetical protein